CTVLEAACRLGEIIRGRRVVFVAGFPPCTDVAVSGARWFAAKAEADKHFQTKAALVAEQCRMVGQISGAPWFFENPVSVFSSIFGAPDYTFHPHEFTGYCADDNYTKQTCLWTGGGFVMPDEFKAIDLGGPDNRIHAAPPGPERANFRSATPKGFARAVFEANAPHLRRQLHLWEAA
ncbi:MAG: dcm methylase, partial [Alphaproteobacteria bacterium]|nr:dcm methylase [Alphaproteobacteria bacterium]